MKRYAQIFFFLSLFLTISTCLHAKEDVVGTRVSTLEDSAWEKSVWISVVDAPVVIGQIRGKNILAADGCNWFVSNVTNKKKVVSAVWMTSGLGVYDIYVNGKLVGEEVLKPGFTHYAKTKFSFTYDVTDAFNTKSERSINSLHR